MKKLIACLIILLFCKLSFCQHAIDTIAVIKTEESDSWVFIGDINEAILHSKMDKIYVRSMYVNKYNNVIKIWAKVISPEKIVNKKKQKQIDILYLLEIDCYKKTFLIINEIQYQGDKTLSHEDYPLGNKESAVIPDTFSETVEKFVCEKYLN